MAQNVKTVGSLAIASVKTVAGVAIASVKTIQGVDNTGGGGVCTLLNTGAGLHGSSAGGDPMPIHSQTATGTGDVCKVRVYWTYKDGMVCKVQIRTSFNGGGSQIGGDSDAVANATGGATGYTDYPWSSNEPAISGAMYINVILVSNGANGDSIGYGFSGSGSFYTGPTEQAGDNMDYELWTLQ